jgi:hypothetical protein
MGEERLRVLALVILLVIMALLRSHDAMNTSRAASEQMAVHQPMARAQAGAIATAQDRADGVPHGIVDGSGDPSPRLDR